MSLFDNVLDLIGQHSLYVLSAAWANDSKAVVQLADPSIGSMQVKTKKRLP